MEFVKFIVLFTLCRISISGIQKPIKKFSWTVNKVNKQNQYTASFKLSYLNQTHGLKNFGIKILFKKPIESYKLGFSREGFSITGKTNFRELLLYSNDTANSRNLTLDFKVTFVKEKDIKLKESDSKSVVLSLDVNGNSFFGRHFTSHIKLREFKSCSDYFVLKRLGNPTILKTNFPKELYLSIRKTNFPKELYLPILKESFPRNPYLIFDGLSLIMTFTKYISEVNIESFYSSKNGTEWRLTNYGLQKIKDFDIVITSNLTHFYPFPMVVFWNRNLLCGVPNGVTFDYIRNFPEVTGALTEQFQKISQEHFSLTYSCLILNSLIAILLMFKIFVFSYKLRNYSPEKSTAENNVSFQRNEQQANVQFSNNAF